jgi:hypothetical protein
MTFMPLAQELRMPYMKDRHWDQIRELCKSDFDEKGASKREPQLLSKPFGT